MKNYKITKAGHNTKIKYCVFVVFNGFEVVATFKLTDNEKMLFGLRLMCESFGECENVKEKIFEFLKNIK